MVPETPVGNEAFGSDRPLAIGLHDKKSESLSRIALTEWLGKIKLFIPAVSSAAWGRAKGCCRSNSTLYLNSNP